ncbi:MAG TPA: hypothetical protein EYG82_01840 [Sulfurovum sp.]|nr:hypothetical protein [Sulfurovum sp.]
MKQKKSIVYFFTIAISLTLFLPVLNLSFAQKYSKINAQSFSKQQLFSTDNLESIKNYFVYNIFNFSLVESQVIAGKDAFFFLGYGHASVVDKTKGTFPYTDKDIDNWANKLKNLQVWYEKQGIEFIIVIASNKHTVYNNKLPNGIVYKEGETITDDIVKYSLNKDINILNLNKALRERRQDKQLYFHTDTHWTNYGALIGYIDTIGYLNTSYTKNYQMPKYSVRETATKSGGDLTNFLRINHFLSDKGEKNYDFIFEKKSKLCYGEITKTNKLNKCTPGIKNTFNQYVINKNAPNKEKLLYLCDSFGLANSKLYDETFHTVWRFHIAYTNGDVLTNFIKEHKPDVVIYQVVERDLGNNSVVDDILKRKI